MNVNTFFCFFLMQAFHKLDIFTIHKLTTSKGPAFSADFMGIVNHVTFKHKMHLVKFF